jgi:hypothetical protein
MQCGTALPGRRGILAANHDGRSGIPAAIQKGQGLDGVATLVQSTNRPAPRGMLRVVDLAEIQQRTLQNAVIRRAIALDNAPVAMLLAILEPLIGAQEHGAESLRAQPARSSTQLSTTPRNHHASR